MHNIENYPDVQPEQWRNIPGHEGAYQVSDRGRVRSFLRGHSNGRLLRPGRMASGHVSVVLGRQCGSRTVHSLVMEAFVGPRPAGLEVRHLDGNPSNNLLSNLEYATRSRNMQDLKWHAGAKGHKLRPVDVLDIKRRLGGSHGNQRRLAREYDVGDTAISAIKYGVSHKDVLP
jgi:hypothetical protein